MDFKKPFKTILRHMTEAHLDEFALGKSLNIYGDVYKRQTLITLAISITSF